MTAPRKRSRHGLNSLMTRVKVRGLGAIDRRTSAARALLAWRGELLADLGGDGHVSAQQRALIELAARTKLYIDSVDAWLVEQPSLIVGRRRALLPVVRERQQLVDSLARILGQLGLERRARPVPSIAQFVRERAGAPQGDAAEGGR